MLRTLVRCLNTQNIHRIYVGNRKLLGKKAETEFKLKIISKD